MRYLGVGRFGGFFDRRKPPGRRYSPMFWLVLPFSGGIQQNILHMTTSNSSISVTTLDLTLTAGLYRLAGGASNRDAPSPTDTSARRRYTPGDGDAKPIAGRPNNKSARPAIFRSDGRTQNRTTPPDDSTEPPRAPGDGGAEPTSDGYYARSARSARFCSDGRQRATRRRNTSTELPGNHDDGNAEPTPGWPYPGSA